MVLGNLYSVGGVVVGYAEAQIVGAIVGLAMGSAAAALGIWMAFKTPKQDR